MSLSISTPIGCNLIYACQRTGCDAVEIVEVGDATWTPVGDFRPRGWSWDINGLDCVLHCPEHAA